MKSSESHSDQDAFSDVSSTPPRRPRPTVQQIVDRLVELEAERGYINQKEMEIIGKLTHGNIAAKRAVATTRILIPRMIESYIQAGPPDFANCLDSQTPSRAQNGGIMSRIRRKLPVDNRAPQSPEENFNAKVYRPRVAPQYILVFVKSLQACVVNCNLARTQCRDARLYKVLLQDLHQVEIATGHERTKKTILEAILDFLCAVCMNDGPNAKFLTLALKQHGMSLREYAAGNMEACQRVSFLHACAR